MVPIVKRDSQLNAGTMEAVLLEGDLGKLTAAERLQYYQHVCESLGLNPLTQPFAYIRLNGKLILYAKRDCTDQLRKIHSISIQIVSRELVEDCYVVTARAITPQNRQDESLGAVPINIKNSEARSNSMMKAETKAKRRVTLSICGLAFLDESELESVQGIETPTLGWEGSGSKEAARAKGEEIIADLTAGKPYRGPEIPLKPLLEASIDKAEEEKAKPNLKSKNFKMLKEFRELHKLYNLLGKEDSYYGILGEHGVSHSNEFPQDAAGLKLARQCYKAMGKDLGKLREEAAAIARIPDDRRFQGEWPDNPPEDGQPFLYNGTVYQFHEESGNWREVK